MPVFLFAEIKPVNFNFLEQSPGPLSTCAAKSYAGSDDFVALNKKPRSEQPNQGYSKKFCLLWRLLFIDICIIFAVHARGENTAAPPLSTGRFAQPSMAYGDLQQGKIQVNKVQNMYLFTIEFEFRSPFKPWTAKEIVS
jgi:hypothetical protein